MKKLYLSSKDLKKDLLASPLTESSKAPKSFSDNTQKTKVSFREKLGRLVERWKNLPIGKRIAIWGALLALLTGIGLTVGYIFLISEGRKESLAIANTLIYANQSSSSQIKLGNYLAQPSVPRDIENPINGELYTLEEFNAIKKNPPLAVMIENSTAARPQSGLDKADVVYEALAEGGITRFMGIYWGKEAKVLGPIRSARFYFVELLSEYDAIYMHIGGASHTGNPKVDAIEAIYRYGIHDLDTGGSFYRTKDRKAPHNAYSSTEILWGISTKRGWSAYDQPKPWKFKRDAVLADRGNSTVADLRFLTGLANGGNYDVKWTYDRKTNLYYRKNGGVDHKDKETELQYNAKNVVIQNVKFSSAGTGKGHVIHEVVGSGDAKILQDGKVIEATWTKANRTSRTIFKDKSGAEIQFNRGQTWIEIYPYQYGSLKITE